MIRTLAPGSRSRAAHRVTRPNVSFGQVRTYRRASLCERSASERTSFGTVVRRATCPSLTATPSARRLDRFLAENSLSTGRLSEYPTDYFIGIYIETSAMAEQNTLWLPRVDFTDCRRRLLPLEE